MFCGAQTDIHVTSHLVDRIWTFQKYVHSNLVRTLGNYNILATPERQYHWLNQGTLHLQKQDWLSMRIS